MAEKESRTRTGIELLQGTLDLLILQTLQWGRNMAMGLAWRSGVAPASFAGGYRFTLSGAASSGKTEVDQGGVETLRKQAAGKILPTNSRRKEATDQGTLEVVTSSRIIAGTDPEQR